MDGMGSTGMAALFRFPNPVNEVSARLVAGGVVLMSIAYVSTGWWPIIVVIAYGFVARVLTGPRLSPLGLLVTRVVTPALGRPVRQVPGPPKRFAQGIGAVVTTTAAVLALGLDQPVAARALAGLIVVAATLESVAGYCVGCALFAVLMRRGLVPDEVCVACADITVRQPVQQG
jgi:hypothetical protein